jgi:hypothetical protein
LVVAKSRAQYAGKFIKGGGEATLQASCSGVIHGMDGTTGDPGSLSVPCPAQGSIGLVLQIGSCASLSCGACALGETCDTTFGLCQGTALFISPNLTLPAATGTTTAAAAGGTQETWVIVVAVVVPAVAVLGVAGTLLAVYLMRRRTAQYDRKANIELRDNNLTAMRATTDY